VPLWLFWFVVAVAVVAVAGNVYYLFTSWLLFVYVVGVVWFAVQKRQRQQSHLLLCGSKFRNWREFVSMF
jgi:hypothetical protein